MKGTFFVLGEVASEHPAIVRRIAEEGHEIACHGYHHTLVSGQSPEEFRMGIRRAKAVLEDVGGHPVIGYRAPSFSIGPRSDGRMPSWPKKASLRLQRLSDPPRRYGDRIAPRFPYEIWRKGREGLIEFPIGTVRLFGVNLPVGGGGYFRLLPGRLIEAGIRRVNAGERKPVMFYFHPWELDPGQPRPSMAWHRRFRHYVGQGRHEVKLAHLLRNASFGTAREVLEPTIQNGRS